MRNLVKSFAVAWLFVTVVAIAGCFAGCDEEGPAERAGKKIDNAAEKAGDAVEDAGDKIEDAVD